MYTQKLKRKGVKQKQTKKQGKRKLPKEGQKLIWSIMNHMIYSMEIIVDLAKGCLGKIIMLLTLLSSRQNRWRISDELYYRKLV